MVLLSSEQCTQSAPSSHCEYKILTQRPLSGDGVNERPDPFAVRLRVDSTGANGLTPRALLGVHLQKVECPKNRGEEGRVGIRSLLFLEEVVKLGSKFVKLR
jgi:hypothetical protein